MIINPYLVLPSVSVDPDAQAFINASGITDPIQQNAINQLVINLKSFGLWSKMKAIYPFVGHTATNHKWNLKDPRDLNSAFRLVFHGGWTHSSNGALPNGSNGYADTFLAPNGNQTPSSAHFSIYSRTSIASTTAYGSNGVQSFAELSLRRQIDNISFTIMWTLGVIGGTQTNAQGLYLATRIANNDLRLFKNGSQIGSTTTTIETTTTLSSDSYFLSGVNNAGSPNNVAYDNKQMAFASLGAGLSSAEANNLYTAVQSFNTILGRQV